MISKSGRPINDLETWRRVAGPKREVQWQDGRSAKEAARAWLTAGPSGLPGEIRQALESHPDMGAILEWSAEPEARVRFDSFKGEPANLDLLVHAEDEMGSFLVAIEVKADESFGATLASTSRAAEKRRAANPRSKGVARLESLSLSLLGTSRGGWGRLGDVRYQLLTATAAALAEGQRLPVDRVILLIHEFVTDRTSDRKHARNSSDLAELASILSDGKVQRVEPGSLYGPLRVGSDEGLRFYLGKAVRDLRGRDVEQ